MNDPFSIVSPKAASVGLVPRSGSAAGVERGLHEINVQGDSLLRQVAGSHHSTRQHPIDEAELAQRVAERLFDDRTVDVHSTLDEQTGRMVHRITDRKTGELISQSPTEELLRFFANTHTALKSDPMVRIEA